MFSPTKQVAWKNWGEWRDVHTLLYSEDEASIMQGVAKVSAWGAKFPLPTAIEVTASLQKNLHSNRNALALSLSIIRFINGVVEPFLSQDSSKTISSVGSQHGIPNYIIVIRHSATHGKLPTFEFAQVAAIQALQWLEENYWAPQELELFHKENDFMNAYIDYLTKGDDPFEFVDKNDIAAFGIDVLVHKIMLNSNQTRGTLHTQFMEKVADLIQATMRSMKMFPSAVGTMLTEEMCNGNGLASIWLEYLISRKLATLKSIAMNVRWADQKKLQKAIPDPVLHKLPDISKSASCTNLSGYFKDYVKWPPTSIGNMPVDNRNPLTLLPSEVSFAEETEEEEGVEEVAKEEEAERKPIVVEEKIKIEEKDDKEESSDSDIEIW